MDEEITLGEKIASCSTAVPSSSIIVSTCNRDPAINDAITYFRGSLDMPNAIHSFTVWLTGLSGAGKTTLATSLAEALREREIQVELLDGDQFRSHLSKGLGFSKEDRDTNVRRIGHVCRLLNHHGIVAVVAAISPYRDTRDEVREMCGGRFVEVYLSCPLDILVQRDNKGLYKRAFAGQLQLFTGVSDPYEPPIQPELVLTTDNETPSKSLSQLIARLRALRYLE